MNNYNYRAYPYQRQTRQGNMTQSCSCNEHNLMPFPENTPPAMAYVPFQQWGEVYPAEKALCAGTLFPCLDLPFMMGCCKC